MFSQPRTYELSNARCYLIRFLIYVSPWTLSSLIPPLFFIMLATILEACRRRIFFGQIKEFGIRKTFLREMVCTHSTMYAVFLPARVHGMFQTGSMNIKRIILYKKINWKKRIQFFVLCFPEERVWLFVMKNKESPFNKSKRSNCNFSKRNRE